MACPNSHEMANWRSKATSGAQDHKNDDDILPAVCAREQRDASAAGHLRVATEEEQIDGVSFPAYRRLQTYIIRRTTRDEPETSTTLIVDLDELEVAHEQERSSDARNK